MDPFELLKKDHETVSQLFKSIESATGQVKLSRFKKLKQELDIHAHIEETIFYPALENAKDTRALTLEAYEEHKVVKEFLGELNSASTPSDEWTAKLTVLKENVEHHVDEEEGELFSKAKGVLTKEQAEALGDRMAAEKIKQGGTVSEDLKKPGLIKTVVNAFLGGTSKATAAKANRTRKTKTIKATKSRAGRAQKAKPARRRASTKSRPTAAAKSGKKAGRKTSSKKSTSKAKAASSGRD